MIKLSNFSIIYHAIDGDIVYLLTYDSKKDMLKLIQVLDPDMRKYAFATKKISVAMIKSLDKRKSHCLPTTRIKEIRIKLCHGPINAN
jgi:hypothetical protein